jgi:hypothetical protein
MVLLSLILGVYHDSPACESRQIHVNGGQDVSKTLLHIALQEGFMDDSVIINRLLIFSALEAAKIRWMERLK